MLRRLFVACCLLLGLPLRAQTLNVPAPLPPVPLESFVMPPIDLARFPTYLALTETSIPPVDRLDLARRIQGWQEANQLRNAGAALELGTSDSFNVINTAENRVSAVSAHLAAIGQNVLVWVDDRVSYDKGAPQAFADAFDRDVAQAVRELWGSTGLAGGVDGDPRIYALFAQDVNDSVAGYFTSQHTYPASAVAGSNEHEMIIFNANYFQGRIAAIETVSVAAHEYQHMLRHYLDENESSWVDEGFSTFTQNYLALLGNENQGFLRDFLSTPQTQLNAWANSSANYGGSLLFISYFYERFGLPGLQHLSLHPDDGMNGVDHTLRELGHSGVDVFFADWVLANALQRPDLGYGYRLYGNGLPPAATRPIAQLPLSIGDSLPQYATHYYELGGLALNGAPNLVLNLSLPSDVRLIRDDAPLGKTHWYAGVGDESNPTLTRSFDLSGLSSATLTFNTWYDLEELWDYAYVAISTDGGQRWQPLRGRGSTDQNPNQRAYGVGFTSMSNPPFGPAWYPEQIDLTPFAGQAVMLRFEVITDDAKTKAGIAIDDVAIPELGYAADFEADDGGWVADGWMRSDNRLPQRAWVQAAQFVGGQVQLTRWLAEGNAAYQLPLVPGVERVLIALSALAPVTTVPMDYQLAIEAR